MSKSQLPKGVIENVGRKRTRHPERSRGISLNRLGACDGKSLDCARDDGNLHFQSHPLPKLAIIGFGRFGRVLAQLLSHDFEVLVHDKQASRSANSVKWVSLEEALTVKTIFIAVPISAFSDLIKSISSALSPGSTVIDVCSVKTYPVKVMEAFLPEYVDIIATHPMFGPDSFEKNPDLKIMMHKVRDQHEQYQFWKAYFKRLNMKIIEMTPAAHDEAAAFSQGITHYIGRILEAMDLNSTPLDTRGFKQLLSVKDQTCKDSWQLYCDLQQYNPYSSLIHKKLEAAISHLATKCPKVDPLVS